MNDICKCGHRKGLHISHEVDGKRYCVVDDCNCEEFDNSPQDEQAISYTLKSTSNKRDGSLVDTNNSQSPTTNSEDKI